MKGLTFLRQVRTSTRTHRDASKKMYCTLLAMGLFSSICTPAWAQSLSASGKISQMGFSYGTNYAIRVYLQSGGVNQLTTCNNTFAFLNTDDTNYQAKVAGLLSADARQKTVTLFFSKDASGWCQINDFTVAGG